MRWLFPFLVVAGACSSEYDVRIRASDSLVGSAAYAEVAIVANCLSQETAGPVTGDPHIFYPLSDTAPSLGVVPAGHHGLFARLVDEECNVRAVGCQEVEIEDGGGTSLTVEMRSAGGFACRADAECVRGRCVYDLDAAVDVGTDDAAADAGLDDSGADGGDSGATDSGPADAGVDGGDGGPGDAGPADVDVPDPCLTAALCDDFESGAFTYDTLLAGDSTVALSTAEAHSGTHSVLIHAAGSSIEAAFDLVPFEESETGERWVRAWYLLPTVFEGITPMSLDSAENSVTIYTAGEDYTALSTYLFPGAETNVASRVPFPTGRWTCVEMHLDYDGPNTTEVFIDSLPAAEMDTPLPNAFTTVRLGAPFREPSDPEDYDIYVDDIAMATIRMGCD